MLKKIDCSDPKLDFGGKCYVFLVVELNSNILIDMELRSEIIKSSHNHSYETAFQNSNYIS